MTLTGAAFAGMGLVFAFAIVVVILAWRSSARH